jgi:hypothetical protein
MRGTKLRTRAERQWVIDNCLFLSRGRAPAAANRAALTTATRASNDAFSPVRRRNRHACRPVDQKRRDANAVERLALSAPMDYGGSGRLRLSG